MAQQEEGGDEARDPSLRDLDGLPAGVRATRSGGHGSDWVQWPQGSA